MSRVVNKIESSLENWGRYFESPREALNAFFEFDARYKALIAQYADTNPYSPIQEDDLLSAPSMF